MPARRPSPRLLLAVAVPFLALAVTLAGPARAEDASPSAGMPPSAGDSGPPVPALSLSVDPWFTFDTGADLTGSAVAGLALAEEWAFEPLAERPVAGIAARAGRLLVLDLQASFWFAILQHEAFGHGGRARELGSTASFSMGSPWGFGRDASAGFDESRLDNDDLLRVYAGGVQANGWAATRSGREMIAGRPMRTLELLLLAWNRYATSAYVLRNTPDPADDAGAFFREWSGGGDAARYLGHLNARFGSGTGIGPDGIDPAVTREYQRLERQAWWNLLDPSLWLALGGTVRHVRDGDAAAAVPVPRLAGRRFLPVLSADWLLDGGVYSLEAVVAGRPDRVAGGGARWSSLVVRTGRGPGGAFHALGAATEKLWQTPALRWGGEAEVWTGAAGGLGGGVRVEARVRRGGLRHLFFQLGVKSDGSWAGRPAGVGPFVRVGYRLPL